MILAAALLLDHMGPADCPEALQYPCAAERANRADDRALEARIAAGELADPGYRVHRALPARREREPRRYRPESLRHCVYRHRHGACRVLTVQYNNTEDDAMEVRVAFRPRLPRRGEPAEQLHRLLLRDELPGQRYLEARGLLAGAGGPCVRKTLLAGAGCYGEDWLFPLLGRATGDE